MPIMERSTMGNLHHYTLLSPNQTPMVEVLSVNPLDRTEDYINSHENKYIYTAKETEQDLRVMEFSTRWLFLIPVTLLLFMPVGLHPIHATCLFILFLVSIITTYEIKRTYESYQIRVRAERSSAKRQEQKLNHQEDLRTFYEALECIRKEAENDEATLLTPTLSVSKYSPTNQGVRHDIDLYKKTTDKNRKILLLQRIEMTLKLLSLQKQARDLFTLARKVKDKRVLYPIHMEQNKCVEEISAMTSNIRTLSLSIDPPPDTTGTPQNALLKPLLQ